MRNLSSRMNPNLCIICVERVCSYGYNVTLSVNTSDFFSLFFFHRRVKLPNLNPRRWRLVSRTTRQLVRDEMCLIDNRRIQTVQDVDTNLCFCFIWSEFRKTDRSLLVSPDGSSRVPFDPQQKPKFGVLKSPVSIRVKKTPKKTPKKTSVGTPKSTAKSTPKRRPSAADFF